MEKIVTGKVRFSYVNVFEPKSVNGGEEKYSITLLIPKTDTVTYQKIMNALNLTLENAISDTFKGVRPANPKFPIYDGDGVRPSGEPFGDECKGHWVMAANSYERPEIVDASLNPILSKSEFYSGCYGRASLGFYAYNTNGNKGVGCGLNNLQKLDEGQPLSGRTTAAEDFGSATGEYGAAQPATPVQGYVPNPINPIIAPATPGYNQAPVQAPGINPTQPQINPITGQPIINNIYGVN